MLKNICFLNHKSEAGTSLVELLIGVSIGLVVIGVAYGLFIMVIHRDLKSADKVKVSSGLRVAMDVISRELRQTALITDTANVNGTDTDSDGDFGEDPVNGLDDDNDGATDEDASDDITIINRDSNNDALIDNNDNRKKIYLDGARRLIVDELDVNGNVIKNQTRDFNLWSLKINCYHYDPAETFVDADSDGQYDVGESYTDSDGDGECDDGFDSTLTAVAGDINAFEVTLKGRSGDSESTYSSLIAPRNVQ